MLQIGRRYAAFAMFLPLCTKKRSPRCGFRLVPAALRYKEVAAMRLELFTALYFCARNLRNTGKRVQKNRSIHRAGSAVEFCIERNDRSLKFLLRFVGWSVLHKIAEPTQLSVFKIMAQILFYKQLLVIAGC